MTTEPTDNQSSRAPTTTLVLGGARSGKSAYAESLLASALTSTGRAIYVATAEAPNSGDGEMSARIARHQERRGGGWTTVEEPLALAETLERRDDGTTPMLVDCLTLWLSNLMAAERDIDAERARLCAVLEKLSAQTVIVSNEVGQGIVPMDPLARRFRDEAGLLNQSVAACVDRVVLVTAGLPLDLK